MNNPSHRLWQKQETMNQIQMLQWGWTEGVEKRVENCTEWRIGIHNSHFMMNGTEIVRIITINAKGAEDLERLPEEQVPTHRCIVGSVDIIAMLNPRRVSKLVSLSCIYIPQDNSGKGKCCQTNTWMSHQENQSLLGGRSHSGQEGVTQRRCIETKHTLRYAKLLWKLFEQLK